MSCGPSTVATGYGTSPQRRIVITDEGFRLFFPLSALYAALWPVLWIFAHRFDLPLATSMPPSVWHAHEMLIGAFGAALIGFLTTAAPEWTDTRPLRGRMLLALAGLWGIGRVIGLLGWDGAGLIGAFCDLAWLGFLLGYIGWLSWRLRTEKLLAFAFWVAVLMACVAWARFAFAAGALEHAASAARLIGLGFLGLLGLALARITVPVTNLVLDPTEATSPFRPHPGRLHLAPGLVLVAMIGEGLGLSAAVSGFLLIAAGAAFLDRVAEAFIGRDAFRAEILLLAAASALAGAGLMMAGAGRLGAPWTETAGLHVAFMGGLGLGVLAVFSIAGLLHTGRPLRLPALTKLAAVLMLGATALRVLPEIAPALDWPGSYIELSSLLWAAAFLAWLIAYLPLLMRPSAGPV